MKYDVKSGKQKDPSSSTSLIPSVDSTSKFDISINTSRLDNIINETEQENWVHSMLITPSTSAEDQATSFFFGNYIAGTELLNTFGNYQYLSTIYAHGPIGQPLRRCVAAVGLAGLANFWKAPNIMVKAHSAYQSVLRLINAGLGDLEEAKSDQTLVSIILLGLYEVYTHLFSLAHIHLTCNADKYLWRLPFL